MTDIADLYPFCVVELPIHSPLHNDPYHDETAFVGEQLSLAGQKVSWVTLLGNQNQMERIGVYIKTHTADGDLRVSIQTVDLLRLNRTPLYLKIMSRVS